MLVKKITREGRKKELLVPVDSKKGEGRRKYFIIQNQNKREERRR